MTSSAIARLMDEHQLILGVLEALDAFADAHRGGGEDRPTLARFARFVAEFADARHHGKEEDLLFTAMVDAGLPRDAGPIAVMLMEHGEGRAHLGRLRGLVEGTRPWDDADRATLWDAAHGYTDLLRGHIQKEDEVLYPMAAARLTADAMARLDAACAAFDEAKATSGVALRALGDELIARWIE
jgi:hemerythrin-like domain-containing protein